MTALSVLLLLLRAFMDQEDGTCTVKHACSHYLGPRDADADGPGAAQRGDAEMGQKLGLGLRD